MRKTIETERLLLRNFCSDDCEDLLEYLSDGAVVAYEPYDPMSSEEVRKDLKWRMSTDEMIAVERKADHKLIGNVYLGNRDFDAKELGYVFNSRVWHQGYACEACRAVIEDAMKHGVHRIYAECDPLNEASWRLLERLGLIREAYLRRNIYFHVDENGNPIWKDTYIYSMLNEE